MAQCDAIKCVVYDKCLITKTYGGQTGIMPFIALWQIKMSDTAEHLFEKWPSNLRKYNFSINFILLTSTMIDDKGIIKVNRAILA